MFLFPYRDENKTRSFPLITILFILFNAYLFFSTYWSDNFASIIPQYGFIPKHLLLKPTGLISSMFLHANVLHLVSNMWFLWLFGDNIEDVYGKMPYIVLYIIAGIAGNFVHGMASLFQSTVPVIGASGAVAGIMGSYLVRFPTAKIRTMFLIIIIPVFVRIHAFWFLGFWMLFEFAKAFMNPFANVSHWAHVGGFMVGVIWTFGRRDK